MRLHPQARWALAAAFAAATAFAQTTAPVATTQVTTADTLEQKWAAVLEKLGSPEFKERESAQKVVEKATWRDLPALQALADKQTDLEIKQRLLKRVDELQVQLAFDPPPINFDVDNATLQDVTTALTKATGTEWKKSNWGESGTFTLHAKEKSLWDVFLALSAQNPLEVDCNALAIGSEGIVWGDTHGAFLFHPAYLSRGVNLQATPRAKENGQQLAPVADVLRQPPRLEFSYGVLVDPRLRFESLHIPQITSVTDRQGKILYHAELANNGTIGFQEVPQFNTTITLPIALNGPNQTITVQGQMKVSVIVSEVTVEVTDMQKQGKTPIKIIGEELVWDQFDPKKNVINFQMHAQQSGMPAMQGNLKPIQITLIDANGRQLASQSIQGGWGGGLPGSDALPIKATFSIATRIEERTIPFTFKDLPVP